MTSRRPRPKVYHVDERWEPLHVPAYCPRCGARVFWTTEVRGGKVRKVPLDWASRAEQQQYVYAMTSHWPVCTELQRSRSTTQAT